MIHMKKHLTVPADVAMIVATIDKEVKWLREHGDKIVDDEWLSSSQGDKKEEEEEEGKLFNKQCSGYKDLNKGIRCSEKTDGWIWIEMKNNTKKYFCKGTHLTRYLQEGDSRGSQNKLTGKRNQKENKETCS
jgi:hypothetical protein